VTFSERMLKIDRRIIFLVIGVCTLLPLLYPVGLPIKISNEVRGVYDHIESLPEGSVFLLSLDFDPASKPELQPQAISLLRHAFKKNLRVVALTLWVSGTGLADQIITQVAREMGAAFRALGISVGQIYSSKLNRAIETGSLMSEAPITAVSELTDSGAGGASAMANPSGSNARIGNAIRVLVNKAPAAGTDNLLVTHKTNIADAFGKEFADVKEAETLIYQPNPSGPPTLVGRVQASEWIAQARSRESNGRQP